MNVRRLVLDVDKAIAKPSVIEIAEAISNCPDVEAVNITVTEIDVETIGTDIVIEGQNLDYVSVVKAIEKTGAVVHSIDQIVCGNKLLERIERSR